MDYPERVWQSSLQLHVVVSKQQLLHNDTRPACWYSVISSEAGFTQKYPSPAALSHLAAT